MIVTLDESSMKADAPPQKNKKRMLEVKKVDGVTEVYINYSSLSTMQSCPRKTYYSLFRGLSRFGSPAVHFGSSIHKALEILYAAPVSERKLPVNMQENLELMAFGTLPDSDSVYYRAAQGFIDTMAELDMTETPPEDKRSVSNGLWLLGHYFKTHKDDPYQVVVDDQGPMIERKMQALMHEQPGRRIYLHGTCDAVMENKERGVLSVWDHKTSSMMGKDFYNRLKPNHQYSAYVWLAQETLGLDTDSFVVNGFEVKKKPTTTRGTPPKFVRQPTRRTPEDLEEMKQAVIYWVNQYLQMSVSGVWPIGSVDSCAMWGGCPYLKVCSSPESIRQNILDAEFGGALDA